MSRIVLYDYWRSSAAYRVRIALGLKGLAWHTEPINLVAGEQDDEAYHAVNPMGLVPTLEVDGLRLTQSLAIIGYLDARWPEPPLLPADPAARAITLARALTIAADIHPINNLSVLNVLRADYGAGEEQLARWNAQWMQRGLSALEAGAPSTGLFGGDAPDLADLCLVPQLYNARRWNVDCVDYPKLLRIDAELRNIPAFASAAPEAVRQD